MTGSFDSNEPLTYVGGKTLGVLNFGADKIRLSEDFAIHLIEEQMSNSVRQALPPMNTHTLDALVLPGWAIFLSNDAYLSLIRALPIVSLG